MNRRETFKTLFVGALAGTTVGAGIGCKTPEKEVAVEAPPLYGRTPEELERDAKIKAEEFLNVHEMETIALLCDIILPATPTAGSAIEAAVPDFIDFIVKDLPDHQLPMRGGLMWLDSEAIRRFEKTFKAITPAQQIEIVEDIAYPDPDNKKPDMAYGIKFFDLMRNLTLTGYYTSKMGIEDLGYIGNRPNIWDGVPEDVLQKHGLAYDEEWLSKCINQENREKIAAWDEEGNLIY